MALHDHHQLSLAMLALIGGEWSPSEFVGREGETTLENLPDLLRICLGVTTGCLDVVFFLYNPCFPCCRTLWMCFCTSEWRDTHICLAFARALRSSFLILSTCASYFWQIWWLCSTNSSIIQNNENGNSTYCCFACTSVMCTLDVTESSSCPCLVPAHSIAFSRDFNEWFSHSLALKIWNTSC